MKLSKKFFSVIIILSFISCKEKCSNKIEFHELYKLSHEVHQIDILIRNHKEGVFKWREDSIIYYLNKISHDTTFDSLKKEEEVLLVVIKYISYVDDREYFFNVKGINDYYINSKDKLEIYSSAEFNPSKNSVDSYRSFNREVKLKLNNRLYNSVKFNTYGYYLKYGYIIVDTAINLKKCD